MGEKWSEVKQLSAALLALSSASAEYHGVELVYYRKALFWGLLTGVPAVSANPTATWRLLAPVFEEGRAAAGKKMAKVLLIY